MRITIDVPDEVHNQLLLIPHGWRRHIYNDVIKEFAAKLAANPDQILTAYLAKHLKDRGVENGPSLGTARDTAASK